MEKFDYTIIGAGVVGLAIAGNLPKGNGLVIEKYETFGRETSSRNSEVIHAGIYYPFGSMKAKLCVEGRNMLYEICKKNNIKCEKIGKIIVATNGEEEKDLEGLYKQGIANGVDDLKFINKAEVNEMEPKVNAVSGIYSPSTGIIDTHNLMKYYELKAKSAGTTFAYGCEVIGIDKAEGGYKIKVKDTDGESYDFITKIIINSAGLQSDVISRMAGLNNYKLFYCKGEYFRLGSGKNKYVNRLVYPHPTKTSLGIHTVIDLQGQIKLGPNAFYVDSLDYDVEIAHAEEFWNSVKTYLPFVSLSDLVPDMSGIRPKLQEPGGEVKDFVICHEEKNGLHGFINLIGIESPGLTSAPAISRRISEMCANIL